MAAAALAEALAAVLVAVLVAVWAVASIAASPPRAWSQNGDGRHRQRFYVLFPVSAFKVPGPSGHILASKVPETLKNAK